MAVWLIRAGKYGQDEAAALEKGVAIIGWQEMPNVSNVQSYEEMKEKHQEFFPDNKAKTNINNAAQLWAFLNKIQKGDIAVLPLKTRSGIALGKVVGNYEFKDGRHIRKVDWVLEEVPRSAFGQDLLYSMGAFSTVCQIKRNDAETRFQAIIKGKKDPHLKPGSIKGPETSGEPEEDESFINLEEQAYDQIRNLIQAKFQGHDFAVLVEAVLNAQGYQTFRSPPGADGGVDILAGHGPMGFNAPRICVQVKSGGIQNDSAIRELDGVMVQMNAEQGLFVSWDGYNKTAWDQVKHRFFRVRLWDGKRFLEQLLANYEKLPDAIQAELPLKRIWVLVSEED